MKLVYFAPSDIQVARVDRQCIVNFCDAVQEIGEDVELVAIKISLLDGEMSGAHPLDLYRIRRPFPVKLFAVPVSQSSRGWWISANRQIVDTMYALRLALSGKKRLVFYTKNYGPALAFRILGCIFRRRYVIAFESHLQPRNAVHRWLLRHVDIVIANTERLAHDLVVGGFVKRERVIGTHQGVDLELVESQRLEKPDARKSLGLPLDKKLVVYTGKIFWGYEEVELILATAQLLRERTDILFVMVGGREDHVQRYRDKIIGAQTTNVLFTGFVAPNQVQNYQFAADTLLLYYPSGIELNRYRSPGKLFEYMAARRPIVSVDLPVLREVLGESDPVARMVPPDSPSDLAVAVLDVLMAPGASESMADRAYERVREFTWEARARKIVGFINAHIN